MSEALARLRARVAGFRATGELDKIIMTKLMHLEPVKAMMLKFLQDAADNTPDFDGDDEWLRWLDGKNKIFLAGENEPTRKGTLRALVPAIKIGMGVIEADGVYKNSAKGYVAILRAVDPPPLSPLEKDKIKTRYGIKSPDLEY